MNNSKHLLNAIYRSSTILRIFEADLIFTTLPRRRYCHYQLFTDGETQNQRDGSLAQGYTAGKWQSGDLNLSLLAAKLQLLGTYYHLNDTDVPSSHTGRQGEGDLKAHRRLTIKNHDNGGAWVA